MERQLFEILEDKIEQAMKKMEELSQENLALKQKIQEKEEIIRSAQARLDTLEEEKELIRGKVDSILQKINRVLE
ncbi:MAG: cell division protein ZapB [Thermodesulfobacteriota bacterium]